MKGTLTTLLSMTVLLVWFTPHVSASESENEQQKSYKTLAFLTPYDISTRDDLLLARHLKPLISGEVANWPILGDIADQLGTWVTQFLDATRIANTITEAMPLEGQSTLRQIDNLVSECAKALHVDKPVVFVRNSPFPNAYVSKAGEKRFLVLTSGLLNLYEGSPAELRFVIGHELGHLKCQHLRLKEAAYGIIVAVQSVNLAVVPDEFQMALPTLALGRLFSWGRESEISADRAGLLCCQDPQVAFNALLRLLSGLQAESSWIDPSNPDFDAEAVIQQYRKWENEPFVEFVKHLNMRSSQAPFIPERVAALKHWIDSGRYEAILDRVESNDQSSEKQLVVVKTIKAAELAPEGETIDPYVIVFAGDQEILTTVPGSGLRSATWNGINHPHRCKDGQPLFFEIWDSNYFRDTLVGGFVIYPINPKRDAENGRTSFVTKIDWDWKERKSLTRKGVAEVQVEFLERAE